MEVQRKIFIFLLLLLFIPLQALRSQQIKTTVEDILKSPGTVATNAVEVEGTVTQYVKGTSTTTSYYLLKGYYGGILKINTFGEPPEINKKYIVVGIVYIDPVTRDPFISEKSKTMIEKAGEKEVVIHEKGSPLIKYLIFLLLILLVAMGGLIFYQYKIKSKPELGPGSSPAQPEQEVKPVIPGSEKRDDLKTIRIVTAPKTMKFIPGELVIISGEDKGKSFKIAGYPTAEGSIITIGREKVSGDRSYAHIQLSDQFKTVSRKQAEIIAKDNKLFVKNLSETNYTQVDGKELAPGELCEFKEGAVIKMGELEMKYQK